MCLKIQDKVTASISGKMLININKILLGRRKNDVDSTRELRMGNTCVDRGGQQKCPKDREVINTHYTHMGAVGASRFPGWEETPTFH